MLTVIATSRNAGGDRQKKHDDDAGRDSAHHL
jgi:hypothetical protein